MKNTLMIKKYVKEFDNGTKNMRTIKSFFGTKLIDIEDNILIDNKSIRYTDIDGYQNYDTESLGSYENETLIDLTKLKINYHTTTLQTQDVFNIENNTKWTIDIDIRNTLREYLFSKIKERRSFKTMKPDDTKRKDINITIYDFIDFNIIDRYELSSIDLYIKYDTLRSSNIFKNNLIQFNPEFDESLYNVNYLITDYGLVKKDQFENLTPIKILFNQIKKSTEYRFDYYFNINYKKI